MAAGGKKAVAKDLAGIGIQIAPTDEFLVVEKVNADGAAAESNNVKKGDFVVSINGVKVRDTLKAKDLIVGQRGTWLDLELQRQGKNVKVQLQRGGTPKNTPSASPAAPQGVGANDAVSDQAKSIGKGKGKGGDTPKKDAGKKSDDKGNKGDATPKTPKTPKDAKKDDKATGAGAGDAAPLPQRQKTPKKKAAADAPKTDDKAAETKATPAKKGAEKPAAKADKPAAKADKPAAKADKPAAKADKPAAKADKPAAKADKPAAKADKPAAKADKPVADAQPAFFVTGFARAEAQAASAALSAEGGSEAHADVKLYVNLVRAAVIQRKESPLQTVSVTMHSTKKQQGCIITVTSVKKGREEEATRERVKELLVAQQTPGDKVVVTGFRAMPAIGAGGAGGAGGAADKAPKSSAKAKEPVLSGAAARTAATKLLLQQNKGIAHSGSPSTPANTPVPGTPSARNSGQDANKDKANNKSLGGPQARTAAFKAANAGGVGVGAGSAANANAKAASNNNNNNNNNNVGGGQEVWTAARPSFTVPLSQLLTIPAKMVKALVNAIEPRDSLLQSGQDIMVRAYLDGVFVHSCLQHKTVTLQPRGQTGIDTARAFVFNTALLAKGGAQLFGVATNSSGSWRLAGIYTESEIVTMSSAVVVPGARALVDMPPKVLPRRADNAQGLSAKLFVFERQTVDVRRNDYVVSEYVDLKGVAVADILRYSVAAADANPRTGVSGFTWPVEARDSWNGMRLLIPAVSEPNGAPMGAIALALSRDSFTYYPRAIVSVEDARVFARVVAPLDGTWLAPPSASNKPAPAPAQGNARAPVLASVSGNKKTKGANAAGANAAGAGGAGGRPSSAPSSQQKDIAAASTKNAQGTKSKKGAKGDNNNNNNNNNNGPAAKTGKVSAALDTPLPGKSSGKVSTLGSGRK